LIEQKMPLRVRDALAKGDTRLTGYRDLLQSDRPDMLTMVNADSIVLAMRDLRCLTDVDDRGETDDVVLPRFRLRH
jgi:hypothetical protein